MKPVLFCVDDDPAVLAAIARDLRSQYGANYRVVRSDSPEEALAALRELRAREEPVALLLVDQRMPQMNGVEFFSAARELFPDARRVLLTAYADTNSAIEAINTAGIHYYLLKPWDPPQDLLYPVLDDLLEDWRGAYQPGFLGVRVVAHRWLPEAFQVKDFLARHHIPYQYLDVETDPAARELLQRHNCGAEHLPLVILENGESLIHPTVEQLAEKTGLQRQAEERFYDLAIVGGGPGGLAAAVYAASEGLRTVMIERQAPGGQAGTSSKIENYLGFPAGLSGAELARRAVAQARRFGVEILSPQEVVHLRADGPYRVLRLADGMEISCHSVVIAVGLEYCRLPVPGLEELLGAGVYYGASITEAEFCRQQNVIVVGAGNSAGQAAMYLKDFASRVYMVVRGESLEAKMSQYLVDRINETANIEVRLHTEVVAARGEDHLEGVTLATLDGQQREDLDAAAMFIFIGARPCTGWLRDTVAMDEYGFVLSGRDLKLGGRLPEDWQLKREPFLLESSMPGVFVVGDARANSVKRVASAVGEGSIAVQFIHEYLSKVR